MNNFRLGEGAMADIISFRSAKEKRDDLEAGDINQLLKRATLVLKDDCEEVQGKLGIVEKANLKKILKRKITEEIFKAKLISIEALLCGIYVSNLLDDFTTRPPASWWAIDYAASDNPITLQQGGDTCFIICGVFPERGNVRMMDLSYYRKIGASLYHRFYNLTNKDIGYHMSRQFETMAQVVQSCMKNF